MKSSVSRWRWSVHLILIGGYFVPGTVFALTHIRHHPALTSTPAGLLMVCATQITAFAIIFALGWLASRATAEDLRLRWRPGWWVVPLGAGYSVALRLGIAIAIIAAGILIGGILVATGLMTTEQFRSLMSANQPQFEKVVNVASLRGNPVYFWLTITVVSFVLAGLREELWRAGTLAAMQKLFPRAFASSYGQYIAVGMIALIFGTAHLPLGWITAVAAGLLGFFLGSLIIFHRSIWPAVFAHGFFDATSFALLQFVLQHLR
jgi:membrane protease YdiL (CAAX protease family)